MKKSQKILLTTGTTIAGAILLIALLGRMTLAQVETIHQTNIMDKADLVNFDKVIVSGSWKVKLVQSDHWDVEINNNDRSTDNIEVTVHDGVLRLRQKSSKLINGASKLEAVVQMPALHHLNLYGSVYTKMSGFKGEQLKLKASGGIRLDGKNNQYDNLTANGSGSVKLGFRETLTTNADINLSGSSNLTITMNGGALNASISGSGSINYYGSTSSQKIKTSGTAEVIQRTSS